MADQPPPYAPPSGGQPGGYPPPVQYAPGTQPGYQQQNPGYPAQPGYPPPQGDPMKQPLPQGGQPGYPPPGQPYPQQHHMQTTIITQPTTIAAVICFGEVPVAMSCPFCQAQITTGTTYENGDKVWLWMAIFCFLGGLLCFWIPLVMDSLKDVHHHCPNCKRVVGTFRR